MQLRHILVIGNAFNILIVNDNYQHYAGEVQISLIDMEDDGQRNLIGTLDKDE